MRWYQWPGRPRQRRLDWLRRLPQRHRALMGMLAEIAVDLAERMTLAGEGAVAALQPRQQRSDLQQDLWVVEVGRGQGPRPVHETGDQQAVVQEQDRRCQPQLR